MTSLPPAVVPTESCVYLLTHKDVFLAFRASGDAPVAREKSVIRPRFIHYDHVCRRLDALLSLHPHELVTQECSGEAIPYGFRFDPPVKSDLTWSEFYLHTLQAPPSPEGRVELTGVFFPNIAQMRTVWSRESSKRRPGVFRRILHLISGEPRPVDSSHLLGVSSTQGSFDLIHRFLLEVDSCLEVHHHHCRADCLRYDSNLEFLYSELHPALESDCKSVSSVVGNDWRESFFLTLVLSGGSAAQLTLFYNGLQRYHPDSLHITQLDNFWYLGLLSLDTVEIEHFHEVFSPLLLLDDLLPDGRRICEEMLHFKDDVYEMFSRRTPNELLSFWIRKSRKMVLSVVEVKMGDEYSFYRGTNLEVSMPTGSLCSERNAIGSALASHLNLRRSDIMGVAVLFVDLQSRLEDPAAPSRPAYRPGVSAGNPCKPCGVCTEWLKKICEVNPAFKVYTFTDEDCSHIYVDSLL